MRPQHISAATLYPDHTNNANVDDSCGSEPDGICHCDPQPDSDGLGMCPKCHRLDFRKSFAGGSRP